MKWILIIVFVIFIIFLIVMLPKLIKASQELTKANIELEITKKNFEQALDNYDKKLKKNMKTVKDLIDLLSKYPSDTIVIKRTDNFEQGNSYVDVTGYIAEHKAKKKKEGFRDAFDGGSYTSEVWKLFEKDGEDVLIIY